VFESEVNSNELKSTPIKPTLDKRGKILIGVAIGIFSALLLAGVAVIIYYYGFDKRTLQSSGFTNVICINTRSTVEYVFPTQVMRDKFQATGMPFLNGFESPKEDGESDFMNFIMSNGDRSTQRDNEKPTNYTLMFPASSIDKIRHVTVYYEPDECITGFSFFDKNMKLLWKHGLTTYSNNKNETVDIAEDERIIGVKAKLYPGSPPTWPARQSLYTDF